MKKTWKVSVEWAVFAVAHVEAETLEEAIKIAESPEFPLPTDTNYIDGTFEADEEMSVELNKQDKHEDTLQKEAEAATYGDSQIRPEDVDRLMAGDKEGGK